MMKRSRLLTEPTQAIDRNIEIELAQARLFACRGQFAVARRLVVQAEAFLLQAPLNQAEVLEARAEAERLAGVPDQAAASRRAAADLKGPEGGACRAGQGRPRQPHRPSRPRANVVGRIT
jgi:hypothetical protein